MEELSKLFTWPVVFLVLGIIFLLTYKIPIGNFISRIRSAGKDGVHLTQSPDQQNEEERNEIVQSLMDLGSSQLRDAVEKDILTDLQSKNLITDGDTVKILVRHLAATQMALDFEQIYNIIFGSQIYMLKKLNEVSGQGKPEEFLGNYFQRLKDKESEFYKTWELREYLGFLRTRSLITNEVGNIHITYKGQEFLVWLAQSGHTEELPR